MSTGGYCQVPWTATKGLEDGTRGALLYSECTNKQLQVDESFSEAIQVRGTRGGKYSAHLLKKASKERQDLHFNRIVSGTKQPVKDSGVVTRIRIQDAKKNEAISLERESSPIFILLWIKLILFVCNLKGICHFLNKNRFHWITCQF